MKKLVLSVLSVMLCVCSSQGAIMQGGVSTSQARMNANKVIDNTTKQPVSNAKITIPAKNYTTCTDSNGNFQLNVKINTPVIMSIEKQNYKPFSVTVTQSSAAKPFTVAIEKSGQFDIKIDTSLCHLGDNNYSGYSANAGQFKTGAVGPVYRKEFYISKNSSTKQNFLVIGSIIGIDTALARGMGQNKISNAFSSPPSVYLNGTKIAEIQINGDNQKIRLPKNLIAWNKNNEIVIKAGRNLMQTAYVDYDDIEFMNLSIQTN